MMTTKTEAKLEAIDRNLEKFLDQLPGLMTEHAGQYALLRHGEVVSFHVNALDAQIAGNRSFGDGLFSIQKVTETVEHLGAYTYARHHRTA